MAPVKNRILVVDDNPEILSEVTSYLRRRGHDIIPASSFGEAVRAYEDNSDFICLLLTDNSMPDGNGKDLARLVIDRSQGTCPCLLMSGNFDWTELTLDVAFAGVRGIQKPFRLSMLYASVLAALATNDRAETHEWPSL
ncbi:MAG: response regulator [Rhodospirillales bacterium]|nr:response regulator [Rhodospirillales bacterium]